MEKNIEKTVFSQKLRKNATKEENLLWYQYLRNHPVQFRRQCVFGDYIVDFYCAKARLILELDGSQHYEPEAMCKDTVRTQYLESLGLQVLRFTNTDINSNLRGVCQTIDLTVRQRYQSGPIPEGTGRRAYSNYTKTRALTPHPPPSGAPSPPRGRFSEWRIYESI